MPYQGTMDYGPYGNYGTITYPSETGEGGGMPAAAIAAPLISAGSSLVGGILGNRAANQAQEAQLAANDKALEYQQGRDTAADARYEQQWNQWNAQREALYQHLGIDIAPPPGGAPGGPPGAVPRPGGPPPGPAPGPQMAGGPGPGPGGPQNIGQMIEGGNPRDVFDWRKMGLRG